MKPKGEAMRWNYTSDHWPYCGLYLVNYLDPDVLSTKRPTVWAAFVRWIQSEQWAREAVTFGRGPEIIIKHLDDPTDCGVNAERTNPWGDAPDEVYLSMYTAYAYEGATSDWLAWESTVLHELVHWARRKAGLDPMKVDDPNIPGQFISIEAGKSFEAEAYNADVNCWRRL
jgi:hypothetical protein